MTPEDFESRGILHFTPGEIEATGASLGDVQARLIQHFEWFRIQIGQPVQFVRPNGLTSGSHTSQLHRMGLAGDATTNPYDPQKVYKAALEARFKGIGLYYRQGAGYVSFHLDLREAYGFWLGVKLQGERAWTYLPLFADPARECRRLARKARKAKK